MFVFLWLLFAVAVGLLASTRGRSGFAWFLIAALLSPLIGFVFLLVTKDLAKTSESTVPAQNTHVRCPACAEWVMPEAVVCKHCGGPLVPQPLHHQAQAKAAELERESEKNNLAIGVTAIFALFVFAALLSQCAG